MAARRVQPRSDPVEEEDDEGEQEEATREREVVEAYVAEHSLEQALNDAVNHVVAARPADPFVALSALLGARSTSQRGVLHVELLDVLAPSGGRAALVRLHTSKGIFTASCSSPPVSVEAEDTLLETLVGLDPMDQREFDSSLLPIEQAVGRAVTLAASMAACLAGAKDAELPLIDHIRAVGEIQATPSVPMPMVSVANAGRLASTKLAAQDVVVIPHSAASFDDALTIVVAVYNAFRTLLEARGVGFSNIGAFGGFAPQVETLADLFQLLRVAVDDAKTAMEAGEQLTAENASSFAVGFGVDFAADAFATDVPDSEDVAYDLNKWAPDSEGVSTPSDEMLEVVRSNVTEFGLAVVVDPFATRDTKTFGALLNATENVDATPEVNGEANSPAVQVAVRATSSAAVAALAEQRACNAIVLELAQFASVSALLTAIADARSVGLAVILAAIPGEQGDAELLAAIAVGAGVGQIKFGGLLAAESIERYNHVLLASREQDAPPFVGRTFRQ